MEKLKKKIKEEAYVIDNRIVKVDHFINHMLDTELVMEIGEEFAKAFPNVTKIVTIEASGIAFSLATAVHLNNIPVVFARKSDSLIMGNCVYQSKVHSFTKQITRNVLVDKAYISKEDRVLIIDDFLATGSAMNALIDIVNQSDATIEGCGIVIEKGFQNGREVIEKQGIKLVTLANIIKIENDEVIFNE